MRHGLRHHLESLAGVDYLAREDAEFLARFYKECSSGKRKRQKGPVG
ncbi:MAG: hypothetical protein BPH100C_184 [Phage 5P_2]|nr:MAG: hypothetical protein BPH100C_184 [Phage 5P_2]NPV30469.1 hypothetical protein [Bacillota bacterium]